MGRHKEQLEYVDYMSDDHVRLMKEGWEYLRFLDGPNHTLIIVLKRPKEPDDGHET